MRSRQQTSATSGGASPVGDDAPDAPDSTDAPDAQAAQQLLREHPDALVYGLNPEGLVVAVPECLGLEAQRALDDGRSGVDFFIKEDRVAMVHAWLRVKDEGVTPVTARLNADPGQWMVVRLIDLRASCDVVLHVLWPTSEPRQEHAPLLDGPLSTTPRFCTRKQNAEATVIECDSAYLEMFGYTAEQVVGQLTLGRVHPDDQPRVIEGWVAMISTGRVQLFRARMKRGDGSWLWVDTTLHNCLGDEPHGYVLAECIDVSAEMQAQEALQDREELLRNLIEEMPDGLLQLDSDRAVVYHNPRLLEILHGSELGAPGSADASSPQGSRMDTVLALEELFQTLTEEARQTFGAVVDRALGDGVREDVELEVDLASGQQRQVLMKVRPLQRASGFVSGVIASVLDVTDSARARRELERRATFDALTGVHNRASIMAALEVELETSADTAVVYVDLDRFKSVNDTFGHAAGDEVLIDVAARLRSAMRSSDEVGRLGGDEFIVLLRGACGLGVAMSAAERISEALRGTCELSCGTIDLCASVGVACLEGPTSAEELVQRADVAMYRSKEQRRGIPVLAA
jgi:diguanylate cyclase (GGDEF)-like protein/PAS domain S-box-containing protein